LERRTFTELVVAAIANQPSRKAPASREAMACQGIVEPLKRKAGRVIRLIA